MSEMISKEIVVDEETIQNRELFQDISRKVGSANFIGLLVCCFGKDMTASAIDELDAHGGLSGSQLIEIYGRNRNFDK